MGTEKSVVAVSKNKKGLIIETLIFTKLETSDIEMNLPELPMEIWIKILRMLDYRSLKNATDVNPKWLIPCRYDQILKRNLKADLNKETLKIEHDRMEFNMQAMELELFKIRKSEERSKSKRIVKIDDILLRGETFEYSIGKLEKESAIEHRIEIGPRINLTKCHQAGQVPHQKLPECNNLLDSKLFPKIIRHRSSRQPKFSIFNDDSTVTGTRDGTLNKTFTEESDWKSTGILSKENLVYKHKKFNRSEKEEYCHKKFGPILQKL